MVVYNRDIPDAPNNPSVDQPKMKENTNSVYDIIDIDHITFEANNGGTHKQTSFEGFSSGNVIGQPASSVAYPAAGVSDNTIAQYYFKNSLKTFVLSSIRAYALVNVVATVATTVQSNNVTSVTRSGVGVCTVVLDANAVKAGSTNYSVFVSILSGSGSFATTYFVTKSTATTFTITTQLVSGSIAPADISQFAFFVMQL